jgi:SAM-dependent methyltransferase
MEFLDLFDMAPTSAYDAAAPTFERHRGLPADVAEAIRAAILRAIGTPSPRLLDLGAGTGRIGRPFVEAGDDYVGADLSFGMLRDFRRRCRARLVQADGERLPFADATFDAVMLIQVFGGTRGWRRVLLEARRVLRAAGALVVGRTVLPPDGVDARMKTRVATILDEMGVQRDAVNPRDDAVRLLEKAASGVQINAAAWNSERTPRGFIERHRTGARFSALPEPVKDEALRRLGAWAAATFGSLDAVSDERHAFELRVFRFS